MSAVDDINVYSVLGGFIKYIVLSITVILYKYECIPCNISVISIITYNVNTVLQNVQEL